MSLINHKNSESFCYQFVFRSQNASASHNPLTNDPTATANNDLDFYVGRTFPAYIKYFRIEVVDIVLDREQSLNSQAEWRVHWGGSGQNYDSSLTGGQSAGILDDVDLTTTGTYPHAFMIKFFRKPPSS